MSETSSPAQPPVNRTVGGQSMELWISYVLRIGVLIAAAVILTGLALYLIEGPDATSPQSLHALTRDGGTPIATDWREIRNGVSDGAPLAIVQLGLLILILTPLTRVAMTLLLFLIQQDWIFVAITLAVLAVLVLGLIGVGS